ncbi:MAG: ABC transporter ATP-binding protein [Pseudoxanthomonas sp.]
MQATVPAVRCRGLVKQFGDGDAAVMALRGVDLDVATGELMMLAGPSGCGKTTLLSIMTSILEPDAGECEVFGQKLRGMSEADRARFRGDAIGFVFQAFNLLPALTAAENVSIPLLLQGRPRGEALQRAQQTLDAVGLGDKAGVLPGKLSGGQQQRVAIARAIVHGPRLVVCDEPTSNLDASAGHDMMEILRRVAVAPDRALIVVTHDPRIEPYADRIASMEDGRITGISSRAERNA